MDKVDFEFKIKEKSYNETFAKSLLEAVYGDVFFGAKVVDRPDIWVENEHGGIGVEVTTLLDVYYNTLKKYKKAWSSKGITIEQIVKTMPSLLRNKLGINQYGNLILLNNEKKHTLSKSLSGLESTIRAKLNRMVHYKKFESQNLFIFATNLSPQCSYDKIQKMISSIDTKKHKRVFDTIIIFDYDYLTVYPFGAKGNIERFEISKETLQFCDALAEERQRVIEKEYDERKRHKKEQRIMGRNADINNEKEKNE